MNGWWNDYEWMIEWMNEVTEWVNDCPCTRAQMLKFKNASLRLHLKPRPLDWCGSMRQSDTTGWGNVKDINGLSYQCDMNVLFRFYFISFYDFMLSFHLMCMLAGSFRELTWFKSKWAAQPSGRVIIFQRNHLDCGYNVPIPFKERVSNATEVLKTYS